MTDLRNNKARARDKWMESAEAKRLIKISTQPDEFNSQFARNRLEAAFIAGWDAAQQDKDHD